MRKLLFAWVIAACSFGASACKEKTAPAPTVDKRSAVIEKSAAAAALAPMKPTEWATPTSTNIDGQILSISPAKFTVMGNQYDVSSNGTLLMAGKAVGKLTAAGQLLDGKARVVAQLDANGAVTFPANPDMKANIATNGELTINGESYISFDDEGNMRSREAKPNPFKNDAAVPFQGSHEMRRTYALIVAANVAAKNQQPTLPTPP